MAFSDRPESAGHSPADPSDGTDDVRPPDASSKDRDLRGQLERLPPGHPSAIAHSDGSPRGSVPDLASVELPEDSAVTWTGEMEASGAIGQPDSGPTGDSAAEKAPEAGLARERSLTEVSLQALDLTGFEQIEALSDAYDVVHEYLGGLMVNVAREMVPDLRQDVDQHPGTKIVFVGRDGRSLAIATAVLDPGLFREHCSEVVLSRALVEAAVQDLEVGEGRTFPQIAGFRSAAEKVEPTDTVGAYRRLTEYLQRNGVRVGEPGSSVTLVDTSYKGTVQELLAAAYPETAFRGRYAFYAESRSDPHPGSKKGYALHLEGDEANNGLPMEDMPADPRLTFSCQDALAAIEETLHGPWSSPRRIAGGAPQQLGLRDDRGVLDGFDLGKVSPRYADPVVRDAVMRVGLAAVADRAEQVASGGRAAVEALKASAIRFRDELRAWVAGGNPDPRLVEYLDSFVRRTDTRAAARLGAAIQAAGLDSERSSGVWAAFGRCTTVAEKEHYAACFIRDHLG
jgi:hypothetical protein